MKDTNKEILASLASGEKRCFKIAGELELNPSKVASALRKLVITGQVVVSGKIRINGKNVAVYAVPKRQHFKNEISSKQNPSKQNQGPAEAEEATVAAVNSDLYLIWGGYVPLNTAQMKKFVVKKYFQH